MRKVAIILATVLIAGTTQAANQDGWVFGSASCSSPTNCDSLKENIDGVISMANQCISQRLAIGFEGDSAFENSRGLNGNDCLTEKSVAKASQGRTIVPRCCIVKVKDDLCQLNCSSIGIQ